MKTFVLAAALFALMGCQDRIGERDEPPYALPDQSVGSHLFASGAVSTDAPEFATTLSPDGRTVYFNRASEDRSLLRIFESHFSGSTWSEATALPFSDGTYRDIDPFVSIDGERLYFSSTRPTEGEAAKDFDIWYVDRTDSGWSAPVNPGRPLNSADDEIFVSETRSGTLYFSLSDREGRRSIVRAARTEAGYAAPEPVHFDIADSVRLGNPAIAPDESFIVVTSGNTDGSGVDLFISRQQDGAFSRPARLPAAINSPFMDFAPYITRDQEYLFLTSERPGIVGEPYEGRRPGDVYITRLPRN